ncbi:hypothetical protein PROPHIGD42-2_3 [Mycobacterium phage prophiGD42-2]|nr:hypothetical protein PROPHIGD11-2_3 [Mycobacterium phage prophiGD11-2]QST89936.1 hypothetical protein PROPHIGD08-2_3 [Mycobacterium phage prophiGD08-2]QST90395.1 hypothetical protein PROPHIGD42-2_3 [Mycobacterium phage prophiGD42-2]
MTCSPFRFAQRLHLSAQRCHSNLELGECSVEVRECTDAIHFGTQMRRVQPIEHLEGFLLGGRYGARLGLGKEEIDQRAAVLHFRVNFHAAQKLDEFGVVSHGDLLDLQVRRARYLAGAVRNTPRWMQRRRRADRIGAVSALSATAPNTACPQDN